MIPWIAEGEKFSLIGLQVATDSSVADGPIAEGLEAYTSLKLEFDGHWREWLGSIRLEDIEACTLILVSRGKSRAPGILDGENQALSRNVGLWYTGLMLACPLNAWQDPITAGGALYRGDLEFREVGTLEAPHDSTVSSRSEVSVEHLVEAGRIASIMAELVASSDVRLWRLMRCLEIYQKARKLRDPMDRIHQFARCVEGLLATAPGQSKKQFKSKTELFIGPHHRETMGTIYDIRSEVEHLHEDLRLEPFDRARRLEIAKMEIVVGELARRVLLRIFGDAALAVRMGSRDDLETFWQRDLAERQNIWGPTLDPLAPLQGLREDHISDEELGLEQS